MGPVSVNEWIPEVQASQELDRIVKLPRREWTAEQASALAERLTKALRTETGRQTLLPVQAIALAEIGMMRGAFVPIPTGGGKTLVHFLGSRMIPGIVRPLALMPAGLIPDKVAELREYRRDWIVAPELRIESYETLARVSKKDFLTEYKPDMILCDEGHFLANVDAARTTRVLRYLRTHPSCLFVVLTGTPTDVSIRQFSHLIGACLRYGTPLPVTHLDLDEWSRALDLNTPAHRRVGAGALERLRLPGDLSIDIREVFQTRLKQTPGVVMHSPRDIGVPIKITSHVIPFDEAQTKAFVDLRAGNTPDGLPWADGVEAWRHARSISSGFYAVWTPRAPDDWKDARSRWARECRSVIANNRREIDTEEQLTGYLAEHPDHYPEAAEALSEWRKIAPIFTPNPVPYWISDNTLRWIKAWGSRPGLIWIERPATGHRLSFVHGIPYYGQEGYDARTGKHVTQHAPEDGPAALSIRANMNGRNLQAWNRNLVVDVPTAGKDWQQLIARTHREGQRAELVTVDVLFGSVEDVIAFWTAVERAEHSAKMFGHAQKLLTADLSGVVSKEIVTAWKGDPRWTKPK